MWQQNSETTVCPQCNTKFTLKIRKHHCRACGIIICDKCSQSRVKWAIPLKKDNDHYAHLKGDKVRVCDKCVRENFTQLHPETLALGKINGHSKLLKILCWISSEINKALPVSATRYISGSKTYISRYGKYKTAQKKLWPRGFGKYSRSDIYYSFEHDKVQLMHALDIDIKIGNCYEMSFAGFYILYKLFSSYDTENLFGKEELKRLLQIRSSFKKFNYGWYKDASFGGDHAFLLLGEELPYSLNTKRLSINSARKIIVFDPWRKAIFYLSQAKDNISGHINAKLRYSRHNEPAMGTLTGNDYLYVWPGRSVENKTIVYTPLNNWVKNIVDPIRFNDNALPEIQSLNAGLFIAGAIQACKDYKDLDKASDLNILHVRHRHGSYGVARAVCLQHRLKEINFCLQNHLIGGIKDAQDELDFAKRFIQKYIDKKLKIRDIQKILEYRRFSFKNDGTYGQTIMAYVKALNGGGGSKNSLRTFIKNECDHY
ncbi:MAG: hypothetical protein GY710_13605 [Desulfobacteraceae bacterium]|nr:hypothetical protein [Desulfobacteraceae bacterium]